MSSKKDNKKQGNSIKKTIKAKHDKKGDEASFKSEIRQFVEQIDSLFQATDMTMKSMHIALNKAKKEFAEIIESKGVKTVGNDGTESYHIKTEDLSAFKRTQKKLHSCLLAYRNIPRIFLCSLIHKYDAYLGRLLRVAFYVKPELLNASQRQLSFPELLALLSLDAAREFLIEKEVESVIRESHIEQFRWMETRFDLALRKDLPSWTSFVEITERRNLFVHCDGIVSSQYLSVCEKQKVALPSEIKLGSELDVSREYFAQAVDCLLEIGIKLGHVLWRKLQPDKIEEADEALHCEAYEILTEERYSLAKILLHFAVDSLKKKSSEIVFRMNVINLAIAYNFSKEREKALSLLNNYDWSASEDQLKLAVAVLEHKNTDAVKLMKRIGADGAISRENYSSWPIFKEFRNTPDFLETYKALFGEDFVLSKTDAGELKEINQTATAKTTAKNFLVKPAKKRNVKNINGKK